MTSNKLNFVNKSGLTLTGILDTPELGQVKAYAIFAHCFTCTKNFKAAHNICQALTAAGIAVLRFDFTGLGESEGDFEHINFSSNVDDLITVSDYLIKNYQPFKLLLGHSSGGTAVLQAVRHIESVIAVAIIA